MGNSWTAKRIVFLEKEVEMESRIDEERSLISQTDVVEHRMRSFLPYNSCLFQLLRVVCTKWKYIGFDKRPSQVRKEISTGSSRKSWLLLKFNNDYRFLIAYNSVSENWIRLPLEFLPDVVLKNLEYVASSGGLVAAVYGNNHQSSCNGEGDVGSDVVVFSFCMDKYKILPSRPSAAAVHSIFLETDYSEGSYTVIIICLIAGTEDSTTVVVQIYNSTTDNWKMGRHMVFSGRRPKGFVMLNSVMFAFCHEDAEKLDSYDVKNDIWSAIRVGQPEGIDYETSTWKGWFGIHNWELKGGWKLVNCRDRLMLVAGPESTQKGQWKGLGVWELEEQQTDELGRDQEQPTYCWKQVVSTNSAPKIWSNKICWRFADLFDRIMMECSILPLAMNREIDLHVRETNDTIYVEVSHRACFGDIKCQSQTCFFRYDFDEMLWRTVSSLPTIPSLTRPISSCSYEPRWVLPI